MTDAPDQSSPAHGLRAAIDTPWAVLALLFLVTGCLGLPVLWISRSFSTRMKIVWSLVATLYTGALVGCTSAVLWWAWLQISQR